MLKTPDYQILDHPSDLWMEVRAGTPEELFADTARAMFLEVWGGSPVLGIIQRPVSVKGYDGPDLMVRWLSELLPFAYEEGLFVCGFEEVRLEGNRIQAVALAMDPKTEDLFPELEIKAVTYHDLELCLEAGRCYCRILMDL